MFKNKIVLITGATSGIGEACATSFAKQGATCLLTGRRSEKLEKICHSLSSEFANKNIPLSFDIRNRQDMMNCLHESGHLNNIDILVNNAGLVIGMDKIADVGDDAINTMIDTNIKGLVYATQAVLKGMKERNSGHIINISSISGTQVYPGGGMYCATKHAVDALTRTLRLELVETPIRVTSIDPGILLINKIGLVETEFSMVRFGGDLDKAKSVYQGIQPLVADDIAEVKC